MSHRNSNVSDVMPFFDHYFCIFRPANVSSPMLWFSERRKLGHPWIVPLEWRTHNCFVERVRARELERKCFFLFVAFNAAELTRIDAHSMSTVFIVTSSQAFRIQLLLSALVCCLSVHGTHYISFKIYLFLQRIRRFNTISCVLKDQKKYIDFLWRKGYCNEFVENNK